MRFNDVILEVMIEGSYGGFHLRRQQYAQFQWAEPSAQLEFQSQSCDQHFPHGVANEQVKLLTQKKRAQLQQPPPPTDVKQFHAWFLQAKLLQYLHATSQHADL